MRPAVIVTLGGWIVYSRFFVSHKLELTHALGGERRTFSARRAKVSCVMKCAFFGAGFSSPGGANEPCR